MILRIQYILAVVLIACCFGCDFSGSGGGDIQPGTLKWKFRVGYNVGMDLTGNIYVSNSEYLIAMKSDKSVEWKRRIAGDSIPVIGADGTVYISYPDFSAINADGTLKWKYRFDGVVSASAIGSDGTIYVASYNNFDENQNPVVNIKSHILAFDSEGLLKWDFGEIEGRVVSNSPNIFSPTIGIDGSIYISADGVLYALDRNGALKWKYRTGRVGSIGADGTLYTLESGGFYTALNPDGTLKWRLSPEIISSSPMVESAINKDGTIYLSGSNGYLLAITPDGVLKWFRKLRMGIRSCPAIGADGTIYISSNDLAMDRGGNYTWPTDGSLYALNPDGTVKWEFIPDPQVNFVSSPVIGDDGVIYVGASNGFVYAIFSESMGLAASSWPKGHANNQNSSAAGALSK